MRNHLLIFLFLLSFQLSSSGQCPENIEVNTQEDLEALMLQYPDCAHIPGNVYLRNFTDLSPLSGIVTIGGDLYVSSTYPLTHLNGLTSLSSVGRLRLFDSDNLTSLSGLESLSLVEDEIHIQLSNLESLNGLSGLTDVGGNFMIWNNPLLTSLTGLENLEAVGGYLWVKGNDALTSVEEVSSLQFVGDDLNIGENAALEIITGFNALHTITDGLFIHSNDNLIAVYGFDTLTTVGDADISNRVNGLAEIACLNQVTEMGRLNVRWGCQTLFLDQLKTVTGDFKLQSPDMDNLIGCDQLANIGGDLILDIAMSNLPDFPDLDSIGGMFLLHSSDQLQVLDGFDQLKSIGVGQGFRGFEVFFHNNLTEISGFNQLEQIEGGLGIDGNPLLGSITGFQNLSLVQKDFIIQENALLDSITGFQNLFHVQGTFQLSNNQMLNDCSAFCTFLLNRDEALPTYVWQNGTDMGSPCWMKSTLLDHCAFRPVTVQDVDLYYQAGKRKSPLQGALVELSEEGALVQSAVTDIEGVGEIRYDELEEGIIYQLDVTFPEMHDELLVRHRVSKADLLDGFELDFPLSLRKKIDTTTAVLDSLNIKIQIFGGDAFVEQLPGYDIGSFLGFLNDWSVISEDHEEVIESMFRVALGAHHIQEYYNASKPFTTKFAKVSYDMFVSMATLVSIYKKTSGLEDKFTSFVESEEKKGNISFNGLFSRASKNLIISILNQAFIITKKTLLVPFMQSFGNSPEEQQFVATMQRLIFILENHVLKPDSELFKAGMQELILQWLSAHLIQNYYINFATQEYVEDVVTESLDMQGTFEDALQHAKSTYAETQVTNDEALFAADLFEANAVQIASVGDILENLSIAITLGSVGSLTPVAGPMMTVATGFKGLAGIISGANFLNYGERIVFMPYELGDIVSHLSYRNAGLVETYPGGYLESLTLTLAASLDSLQAYQADLGAALEGAPLSSVSSTYLDLDDYYQYDFLPQYTTMKDIAAHVANAGDSTLRQSLFEYTSRVHRFEMQYLVLQLQLTAIHLDSTEVNYRDSAVVTISESTAMHDSLVSGFETMYAGGTGVRFGPYVSVRGVTIPDSLSDSHFEMQVMLENVGPATTPFFEVELVPNENTAVYKLVNEEEVTGSFDSLELALGEQAVLDFRVYVVDADSAMVLTVDIEGVEGNDLSIPVSFIAFEKLVNTAELPVTYNEELVRLYPNPARDGFVIQSLTDAQIQRVNIYRMTGQLVYTTSENVVDTRGWEPGMYLVEVVMDKVTVIKKLVVE